MILDYTINFKTTLLNKWIFNNVRRRRFKVTEDNGVFVFSRVHKKSQCIQSIYVGEYLLARPIRWSHFSVFILQRRSKMCMVQNGWYLNASAGKIFHFPKPWTVSFGWFEIASILENLYQFDPIPVFHHQAFPSLWLEMHTQRLFLHSAWNAHPRQNALHSCWSSKWQT